MMTNRQKSLKSLVESLEEAGYSGQGHSSGAESFHGGYFGFGGDKQLAKKPVKAVRALKKKRDAELADNVQDQQQRNRGYPAAVGYAGGDGGGGPGSGVRIPNTINQVGKSAQELDAMFIQDPTKDYWGDPEDDDMDHEFTINDNLDEQVGSRWVDPEWVKGGCLDFAWALADKFGGVLFVLADKFDDPQHVVVKKKDKYLDAMGKHDKEELLKLWNQKAPQYAVPLRLRPMTDEDRGKLEEDEERYDLACAEIEDQLYEQGVAGGGGPGRAVASDSRHRDLPGFPRHNALEYEQDHIPPVEGDIDGDGEEDEYLGDDEYVNDVLRLNGLEFAPGDFKRLFGVSTLEEQGAYVSPGYGPEPNKGIERYKQGDTVEDHEPDATKKLIKHVDYTQGHADMAAANHSPGAQAYGQIGSPKNFVPEDWEQRHWKTKEEEEPPMDMSQLEEMVQTAVRETLEERRVMSSKKLVKKLKKNKVPGCDHVRQKGSHATFRCDVCQTVVPVHGSQDIKPGTLKSIERALEPCLGNDWLDEAVTQIVARELEEAFTGIHDETGKGKPKGGSEAFRKNRAGIINYDEKQRPKGTEDLENYQLGDDD